MMESVIQKPYLTKIRKKSPPCLRECHPYVSLNTSETNTNCYKNHYDITDVRDLDIPKCKYLH